MYAYSFESLFVRLILYNKYFQVQMYRGKNGFGFSVVDSFPVKVGRVDDASPAKMGGLKKGDYIIKVNGQNVSRSTCVSVAKLVK